MPAVTRVLLSRDIQWITNFFQSWSWYMLSREYTVYILIVHLCDKLIHTQISFSFYLGTTGEQTVSAAWMLH